VLNFEPAASEVDVLNPKPRCLAPAQPAIRKYFHQEAVVVALTPVHTLAERIDGVGEIPDFIVRQIPFGGLTDLGEIQPVGWIGGEPSVLHRHLQAAGKHVDDFPHTRRRLRFGEATSPSLDRAMGQRAERVAAERGLDVARDNAASTFS